MNYIKAEILSWFGRVYRKTDCRIVKKRNERKPISTRVAGRPMTRWESYVKEDIRIVKINNWTKRIQDRDKWKQEVERAKNFKQ